MNTGYRHSKLDASGFASGGSDALIRPVRNECTPASIADGIGLMDDVLALIGLAEIGIAAGAHIGVAMGRRRK